MTSKITTSVEGYIVTMKVISDKTTDVWKIIVSAKTNRGLGQTGRDLDYPYFVETIEGTGTLTKTRQYIKDGYLAVLAVLHEGEVDYSIFNIVGDIITPSPGIITKELVTNLTSDENIIKAALILVDSPGKYTYVKKYQEGTNWVFVFTSNDEFNYVALGPGAGLSKFLAANWKSVSLLLTGLGVVTIIWMWRDVSTKAIEKEGKISDNTNDNINKILSDPTLTAAQKAALIEQILKNAKIETDWESLVSKIFQYTIIIMIVLILYDIFSKYKGK